MLEPSKIVFDSVNHTVKDSGHHYSVPNNSVVVGIAHGCISTTDIIFVNEGIRVRVTAEGYVDFYDNDDKLLASAYDPANDGGPGHYECISCEVNGDKIILNFPLYEWEDNYPHCDGEFDRWDCHLIGYKSDIAFNLTTHCLVD